MNTIPKSTLQLPSTQHLLRSLPTSKHIHATRLNRTSRPPTHQTQSRPFTQTPTRTTSSSSSSPTPKLHEWLAQIPDHPNTLPKRREIRPAHLARIDPYIKNRTVVMGGAFLGKHPEADEFPDMLGSFILVRAATREEAVRFLSEDPYAKGGVWDLAGMTMWAFKSAFRVPVE